MNGLMTEVLHHASCTIHVDSAMLAKTTQGMLAQVASGHSIEKAE